MVTYLLQRCLDGSPLYLAFLSVFLIVSMNTVIEGMEVTIFEGVTSICLISFIFTTTESFSGKNDNLYGRELPTAISPTC